MGLSPLYLLDTNNCFFLIMHQPLQVTERFSACRVAEVPISAITDGIDGEPSTVT